MIQYKEIIHKLCGKVAFKYSGKIGYGVKIESKYAILPDGTKPRTRELMVCGSCGKYLRIKDTNWKDYIDDTI